MASREPAQIKYAAKPPSNIWLKAVLPGDVNEKISNYRSQFIRFNTIQLQCCMVRQDRQGQERENNFLELCVW